MTPRTFAVAVCFASCAAAAAPKDKCMLPSEFRDLWPPRDEVAFQPTTLEERQLFSKLIPDLLTAAAAGDAPPEQLRTRAASAKFELEVWQANGERFWVLRERRDARRGAGAYVFRTGKAEDLVLQAPHAYYDLGTGELGAALFLCAPEGRRPRAFLTNTAHRFRSRPDERRSDPDHPADVAHNPDHLFQVVTHAIAESLPNVRVIQLHGFGAKERREKLAAVVSSGTRTPAPWVRAVANRLGTVLGDGVRLFPDDTEVLGGTRNAQGRLLQAHPRTRFVHLELSPAVRKALTAPEKLTDVAAALFAPEEE